MRVHRSLAVLLVLLVSACGSGSKGWSAREGAAVPEALPEPPASRGRQGEAARQVRTEGVGRFWLWDGRCSWTRGRHFGQRRGTSWQRWRCCGGRNRTRGRQRRHRRRRSGRRRRRGRHGKCGHRRNGRPRRRKCRVQRRSIGRLVSFNSADRELGVLGRRHELLLAWEHHCACYPNHGAQRDGAGQTYSWGLGATPAGCPATVPVAGAACGQSGLTCNYDYSACAVGNPSLYVCQGGSWTFMAKPCS